MKMERKQRFCFKSQKAEVWNSTCTFISFVNVNSFYSFLQSSFRWEIIKMENQSIWAYNLILVRRGKHKFSRNVLNNTRPSIETFFFFCIEITHAWAFIPSIVCVRVVFDLSINRKISWRQHIKTISELRDALYTILITSLWGARGIYGLFSVSTYTMLRHTNTTPDLIRTFLLKPKHNECRT